MEVDLLNPKSLLHKKSMAGYEEAKIKRNFTSGVEENGQGVPGRIPGISQTSVELKDGRIPGSVESAKNMAAMRIPGDIENRRGSLSLHDRRGSGSGRVRTNTMPSLLPTGSIQTSQNAKPIKEEQESQSTTYQSSQSMPDTRESVPMKPQGFQSSQSMVETEEYNLSREIPTIQNTKLEERRLSAPVIKTKTKSTNRKLSEVLMSSWFFQRKSSDSETDLKSLAEENNQEEEETKTLSPVKNNANHYHKDNDTSKKMSLSNFVAGNFTARDLRSLNAFVPQST